MTKKVPSLIKFLSGCCKLCLDLHQKEKGFLYLLFFLLLYLTTEGLFVVEIIQASRLEGCPLDSSKVLQKSGYGTTNYWCDASSRLVVVKCVDKSVV